MHQKKEAKRLSNQRKYFAFYKRVYFVCSAQNRILQLEEKSNYAFKVANSIFILHGKLHSQVYNEFLDVNIVREKIVNDLIFTNNQC